MQQHTYDKIFEIFSNDNVEALERTFSENKSVWIHGSASIAYKTMLRERKSQKCVVTDFVHSVTGHLTLPVNGLNAPLGRLTSSVFVNALRRVDIFEQSDGFHFEGRETRASYLYVMQCDVPRAALSNQVLVQKH